jgi:L-lactate dehydrogenase complex protein LldG
MHTSDADAFVNSLGGAGVAVTETTAVDFESDLASAVEPPAVGAPLPFDGLSLAAADSSIETAPTAADLASARTGVTAGEFGVVEYGSVAVRSRPGGDEPISLYPERHVAVVRASDLVDLDGAFDRLSDLLPAGESVVFATGASATADMGEFVQGVHGPGDVRVLLVGDR